VTPSSLAHGAKLSMTEFFFVSKMAKFIVETASRQKFVTILFLSGLQVVCDCDDLTWI